MSWENLNATGSIDLIADGFVRGRASHRNDNWAGSLGMLVLIILPCNGANLTLGLTSSTLARGAGVA